MKQEILHFKVHPSILNLPRQMFWYEDKQAKAIDIMDVLTSGEITIRQVRNLLNGDAYFITEDDGETLTLVEKEDKEWKKELKEHIEFLERRKIELEKEKKEQRKILEKDQFFFGEDKEAFEITHNNTMEELTKNANLNLAKGLFMQKWTSKDKAEKEACDELIKDLKNKVFDFIFKGHEYKFKHSARNQSECPHCEHKASDGFMWDETRDKKAFIGKKKLGDDMYAYCFECPKCFNKFFYHNKLRK